jgi:hypothetical protein
MLRGLQGGQRFAADRERCGGLPSQTIMINRKPLVCDSCGTKVIARTQICSGDSQVHSFPCPRCGVGITFVLHLDQEHASFEYEPQPSNATWVESETGAEHSVAFNAELLIPQEALHIEMGPSPFIMVVFNFRDFEEFQQHESTRRSWKDEFWPITSRLRVHLEKGNVGLLEADMAKLMFPKPKTRREQLASVATAIMSATHLMTYRFPGWKDRIEQRLVYAASRGKSQSLLENFAAKLETTGRSSLLWHQLCNFQDHFVEHFAYLSPLLQPRHYWKSTPTDLTQYVVSDKRFSKLKQLYIDAFETLCKLSVLAIGLETIAHHDSLDIPTKKGSMDVWEYEGLPNANKRDHLARYPTTNDLIAPYVDTNLRNGIGHNTARYDAATDEVVWLRKRVEQRLHYTLFCDAVMDICSALYQMQSYYFGLWAVSDGVMSPGS